MLRRQNQQGRMLSFIPKAGKAFIRDKFILLHAGMNNEPLSRLIEPIDHHVMTHRQPYKSAIQEGNQRMAFPEFGLQILQVSAVEMGLKAMVLRRQHEINGEASFKMGDIDLLLELRGCHGCSPEGQNAGDDGGPALVGVIGEKRDL